MNTDEKNLFITIAIAAVVLGIIIGYFFISIIRQQRRNIALQKQNMRNEINAMESERARIANDLHDDVSPILSVIRFQINSIQLNDIEDKRQVQTASVHLDNLIQRLREISNNLMPASLLRKGLVVSIGEFLRNVEGAAKLHVDYQYSNDISVSQEKSIQVYRVLQEVVHNSIKHAGASALSVQLDVRNDQLFVIYSDDGVGFHFDVALKNSSGLGLRSIKNRVDLIGGTMQTTPAQKGNRFVFQIPLN